MAQSHSKRLQVYVSSTILDIVDEYQAVIETILTHGHFPVGMGTLRGNSPTTLDLVYQWIEDADLYVLLLGNRYGDIEPDSGQSWMHLEYEHAIATDTPILALVVDNTTLAERVQRHGLDIIEANQFAQLEKLRNSALVEEDVHLWNTPQDIETILTTRLPALTELDTVLGWHRPPARPEHTEADGPAPPSTTEPEQAESPTPLGMPEPMDLTVALQTLYHLSVALEKTAGVAHDADQITDKLTTALATSANTSDSTVSHVLQLQETVAEGARTSKRLAETAQQMTKIVQLMNQVSSRVNVIALNTSIEVSRLGHRSEGFAQIADDLRQLASHTAKVSQAVETITSPLQTKVNAILTTLGQGIQQSLVGAQHAQQTQQSLAQLEQATAEIEQLWHAIATTTSEHRALSAQTVQVLQPEEWQQSPAPETLQHLTQALQKLVVLRQP